MGTLESISICSTAPACPIPTWTTDFCRGTAFKFSSPDDRSRCPCHFLQVVKSPIQERAQEYTPYGRDLHLYQPCCACVLTQQEYFANQRGTPAHLILSDFAPTHHPLSNANLSPLIAVNADLHGQRRDVGIHPRCWSQSFKSREGASHR